MKNVIKLIFIVICLAFGLAKFEAQTFTFSCGTPTFAQATRPAQPSDCINFLKDFIPNWADPVLEVKVHFWIWETSVGGVWSANTPADADNLLSFLNAKYANLAAPKIFNGVNYPSIPAAKIKFVRSGFTKSISSLYANFWNVSPPTVAAATPDPDAMNLCFGDCMANGNPWCGIWGAALPNQPSGWSTWPLWTRWVVINGTIPSGSNFTTRNFSTDNFIQSTVLHEITHALGNWWHTDGSGYNSIQPVQGCCNEVFANDYLENEGSHFAHVGPCNDPNASNQILAYNPECREYLSPQQCAIMQYNLRTFLKGVLTTNSYCNHLQNNPYLYQTISSDQTWDRDHYCKGDVYIQPGKKLIINCLVGMAENTRIIVAPKGQLVINAGGHITNISGHIWRGIEVRGDPNALQTLSTGGYADFQGIVWINGGTISHAERGIYNFFTHPTRPTNTTLYNGGIVIANGANFIDNVRDVEFRTINALSGSYFTNCQFKTIGAIGYNLSCINQVPLEHMRLSGLRNVRISGCNFEYTAGSMYAPQNRGKGIHSVGAGYSVDKLCNNSTAPCAQKTYFKNLTYGIWADNISPISSITVKNSKFECLYLGAYLSNMNSAIFDNNYFVIPNDAWAIGMYLKQSKYYNIKNNTFKQELGPKIGYGIYAYDSKDGAHQIYKNKFTGMGFGISALDNNLGTSTSNTGLQMNCNDFTDVSSQYDIIVGTSGNGYGVNMPAVKKIQGTTSTPYTLVRNKYSVSNCNNSNKWYVDPNSTYQITHGCNTNSSSNGVTDPTSCKSTQVNVSTSNTTLNYDVHCPNNSASSGGDGTPVQKLQAMNIYLTALRASGAQADPFEIQATVASKLNYFLMDSLKSSMDSAVQILIDNPGNMADADLQLVHLHMSMGKFETASTLINAMGSDRSDWKLLFSMLIQIYQDSSGIYSLEHNNTFISFMTNLANSPGKDGQGIAQALLKFVRNTNYELPMLVGPELELQQRAATPTAISALQNTVINQITIYPNPTPSGINVFCQLDTEQKVLLEINDLLGKQIFTKFISSKGECNIPLNHLSNGVYILTVTRNMELMYKTKVIKQD